VAAGYDYGRRVGDGRVNRAVTVLLLKQRIEELEKIADIMDLQIVQLNTTIDLVDALVSPDLEIIKKPIIPEIIRWLKIKLNLSSST